MLARSKQCSTLIVDACAEIAESGWFNILFYSYERTIAHARDCQRCGSTFVDKLSDVRTVVLPASSGWSLGDNGFASAVLDNDVITAVGALTYEDGNVARNGNNNLEVGATMITMILSTNSGNG